MAPLLVSFRYVLAYSSLNTPLICTGLHILPERGRRVQTDDSYEMGTSSVCYVDPGSLTWQRNLPRASTRRRKGPEDTLETCKLILMRLSYRF